jgi:hypothetical protein
MSRDLTQERARVFRILHRDNLRWTLCNGLHCANAGARDPNFVPIGNADLINRRRTRYLPAPFEGTLSDYVPFYFTPFSPMMYNIKTGYSGITRRPNEDIVILVSSFSKLRQSGVETIFSDRHAYLQAACFHSEAEKLDQIDWKLLQARDFRRDPNDPGKFERYEAECLARTHVPVSALIGVACFNESAKARVDRDVAETGVNIDARILPQWYFS